MTYYKITRFYRDEEGRDYIKGGLTLEEAQAHCQDPETSSSTATDPDLSRGPWFDGYEEMTGSEEEDYVEGVADDDEDTYPDDFLRAGDGSVNRYFTERAL